MLSLCHFCADWFLSDSDIKECTCKDCLAAGHSPDPFECGACTARRAEDHYWSVQQCQQEKREREGKETTRWA